MLSLKTSFLVNLFLILHSEILFVIPMLAVTTNLEITNKTSFQQFFCFTLLKSVSPMCATKGNRVAVGMTEVRLSSGCLRG